jgi:hypothetical protein
MKSLWKNPEEKIKKLDDTENTIQFTRFKTKSKTKAMSLIIKSL